MPKRSEGPEPVIPSPEGGATPEELKRIEESGKEFEAEKRAAQASREQQPEGRPAKLDYAEPIPALDDKVQKARIRQRISEIDAPKTAQDFAQSFEVPNDQSLIHKGIRDKFMDRLKSLFKR